MSTYRPRFQAFTLPTLLLASAPAAAELFISEYIEGSSNNKAIEIFNPDGLAVDLATDSYQLLYYFNGSASAGLTIALTGVVASGEVYIVAQSSADAAILAQADQTDGSGWYNGDDAVVLQKNGTVVDSIGQVGFDPGTEWGADLTSTADNTLRRQSAVCAGDTSPGDAFDPSIEWDGYATNTFDGLGSHAADCVEVVPKINEFSASTAGTDVEYVEIFGAPETDYSDYSVLEIEGDGGSGTGTVDEVIALGATDGNGLYLASLAANALENGTLTLLLVRNFSGTLGDDLDANDDGVLDSQPWDTAVDGVVVHDGGAGDFGYWIPVLGPNYDGLSSFPPGSASRIPDGFDTDGASDWVRNDFDLAGIPGFGSGTWVPGEAVNTPGEPNTDTLPLPEFACGNPVTLISEVQGSGGASPLAGTTVDVEAIVTAVFQGAGTLGGIFLQEEDADADADPLTSEGLFAFTNLAATVGDRVRVRGLAIEFNDLTELGPVTDLAVCSSGNPLPAAAPVTLPMAALDSFEALENMRVALPPDLYITDVFTLWRFGEFRVSSELLYSPTVTASPGASAIAQAAANELDQLIVDDGRTAQNLVVSHTGEDDNNPFDAGNPIRIGQTISGLAGVMHYAFGAYRLQPTEPFVIDESAHPRTAAPADVGGTLKVASFNVLNYFAVVDDSGPICGPAGNADCRGADSASELDRQTAKLVAALAAIDADVAGLIELENDAGASLALLVDALNAAVGAGSYAYVDTGTIGSDGIKQGLIYRPATVTPEGDFALLDSAVDARFNDVFNRPALAQTFRSNANLGLFTVVVNHLKSKGSDCNVLGDPDTGDGQGNCNLTRLAAAEALADWVNGDPTGTGAAAVLVLGDLNSYAMEDPVGALEAAGLLDLVANYQGPLAYTFSFDGQLGSLDYAFGTPAALAQSTGATVWNINSPEAVALDYNVEFGKPAQYFAPDAFQSSDHDPVIIGLDLNPPSMVTVPTTDPDADADVTISGGGDSCGFTSIGFVDPDTLSPAPPGNLEFPFGVLQFTAAGCTPGATVTIEVTLPAIPDLLAWYKLIGGMWQVYPASLAGSTFSLQVTDGGMGDADGAADGQIADPSGPAIALGSRASVRVTKDFSDNNPAGVEIVLSCNTGLPLEQSRVLAEGEEVTFIVTEFDQGELDCTVSEAGYSGYTTTYAAGIDPAAIAGAATSSEDHCAFEDIVDGRMICAISNELDEVVVTVNKEWITAGPGTPLEEDVLVTLVCSGHHGKIGSASINVGSPGVFNVLPHYEGETCHVTEVEQQGFVSDTSDCDGLAIGPGSGAECTVINTRFFEGIPSLSRTGLAVLVLLTLSVALASYRRAA